MKIITKKLLGSIEMMRAQIFCKYKLKKVFIVCKSEILIFTAFYMVLQVSENFNNGQKFIVLSLISSLN